MNQGKMWTVVKPTVGIPLLLGSVAVTSLLVHAAVLFNTTWYPAFYQGGAKKTAMIEAPATTPDAKLATLAMKQ